MYLVPGSASMDIFDYIDSSDIFNSSYLYNIDNIKSYDIVRDDLTRGRLDLVAKSEYDDYSYMSILGFYNRLNTSKKIDNNLTKVPNRSDLLSARTAAIK